MPTTFVLPDILYLLSREQLLPYEDARFNSLQQAVANFYVTRNEQTIPGEILRAYAIELAKLDYAYQYDIVGKEPQYLTPPDIKRRWADPLFLSSLYPTSDQYDQDYKLMIVNLLAAYKQGATVKAIQDVIFAYTGKTVVVEELYRQIGIFYDQSDRNSIRVSVSVGGSNPLTDITSLNQLQIITQTLYNAIALIKPAHVGLNFTTVFSEGESLDTLITDIEDSLRIYVLLVEEEPFDPMLIIAPVLDPTNPTTTVAGRGMLLPKTLTTEQWTGLPNKPSYAPAASPTLKSAYTFVGDVYVLNTQGAAGQMSPTKWIGITHVIDYSSFTDPTLAFLSAATGEVSNWDITHPAGLVAPRLNQAWEISGGDQAFTFEMD